MRSLSDLSSRFSAYIFSESQRHEVTTERMAFCLLASKEGHSFEAIGKHIGKHRTSVDYLVKRAQELISIGDRQILDLVDRLRLNILPGNITNLIYNHKSKLLIVTLDNMKTIRYTGDEAIRILKQLDYDDVCT